MKRIAGILMALALSVPLFAYEKTDTLVGQSTENGAFVSPVIRFTQVDSKWGLMLGGRAGWIINHSFTVAGAVYQLIDKGTKADIVNAQGNRLDYRLSYGGLELGIVESSDDVIHATFSTLLGAGGVKFDSTDPGQDNGESPFYVFEPNLAVVLNVTKNLRMNFGASYRLVTAVDSKYFTNEKVNGPSIELGFNLGFF